MWKHMALRQLGIYTQQSAIKMATNLKKKDLYIILILFDCSRS